MSVLSPPWPSQPWNSHSAAASFSALAAPVIPPLDPLDDEPFPTHGHSPFSALAASPLRRFTHPMSRHQSPVPVSAIPGPSFGGLPQRNMRSLDQVALVQILDYFSQLLPRRFGTGRQIRLVIHGGAVMLLNAGLAQLAAATAATDGRAKQRSTTRDIDYIARSFSSEWAQRYGVYDANERLKQCIFETAMQFGLGADWMNSDADVALPMATDPTTGAVYDPIHAASIQGGDPLTVYTSPNGSLKLVSVTPMWTVALKMVRYNDADREDICIILRSGTQARQLHWTPTMLELWLTGTCWAMGYTNYDNERIKEVRRRMREVVDEVNRWDPGALADDGSALNPAAVYPHGAAHGYGYGYMQQPNPAYNNYHGAVGGDPRMGSPFKPPGHSPPSHSGSPVPFILGAAPTPPPAPPKKKKLKKSKPTSGQTTAVTTWPSHWTNTPPSSSLPQQTWDWDPESAERWDQDVRQAAAKEKTRMGWIPPFLKSKKQRPSKKRGQYSDSDSEDSQSENEESNSEDEDWLDRARLRWGTTGRDSQPQGQGAAGGFHHNVADFMSNGMTPIAAPSVMSAGSGAVGGRGPTVLPGWNAPGAAAPMQPQPPQHNSQTMMLQSHTPPPWAYAYLGYGAHAQRQRSPPVQQQQQMSVRGPDMNQVAAGMNALGLYS
ncbi:hypothetical protein C8F04DRAFT_591773 [Mycena alexandri]|uniref:Uncharacterized protein n=1 Tax=Mycena alexandri TaxID=1745969 RepID=A0AAD6TEP2_9AGAR|nr:hypothetical protein C8F04DRAFT_591773 [Mycena alexandri]